MPALGVVARPPGAGGLATLLRYQLSQKVLRRHRGAWLPILLLPLALPDLEFSPSLGDPPRGSRLGHAGPLHLELVLRVLERPHSLLGVLQLPSQPRSTFGSVIRGGRLSTTGSLEILPGRVLHGHIPPGPPRRPHLPLG